MTRRQILRSLGLAQTVLCGCLLLALWQGAQAYRASVQGLLRSMSETLLTACDTLKLVGESVQSRERILQESVTTLRSYRDVVQQVKASAIEADSLVPAYAASMTNASQVLKDTSIVVDHLADRMDALPVPTGFEMEEVSILGKAYRIKPKLTYAWPFRDQVEHIRKVSKQVDQLRAPIDQTAILMVKQSSLNTQKISAACDQSVRLLEESVRTLLALKNEELRQAVQNLGQAASQLKGMSAQIREFERVAGKVWLVGLLFGAALLVNALFMLFLPLPQADTTNPAGKSA